MHIYFKPAMAFFLALLMFFGAAPVNILAQENSQSETAPIGYIYFDGERVPLDDERIMNVVPVGASAVSFEEGIEALTGGGSPNVVQVIAVSGEFARDPDVFMGATRLSAQRYVVEIDGIHYEAFCADPALPGPESPGAAYQLTGPAADRYMTVLRYGFTNNPYFSWYGPHVSDIDDRMFWAYVTRVAIAMANNPNRQFTGDDDVISYARDLVNGTSFWARNFDETKPAIMVNGSPTAEDFDNVFGASVAVAQSEAFVLSYHRRNQSIQNRFRFEWADGTPAGAELVVNGDVIATAPANSSQVFWGDVSFHIQMPNTAAFHNQAAKVHLVGIHNDYANRVWLMQNETNRDNWQDVVFFIPYMRASAAFSFEPQAEEAGLRIVKRNPAGQGLAGAVFQITGQNGFNQTITTPANGVIFLEGLEPGEYTITELSPPPGHQLASPATITVTIPPGNTEIIERVFINPPYSNGPPPIVPLQLGTVVQITKADELTSAYIPGAVVRLVGITNQTIILPDGTSWQLDNTGINITQTLTAGAPTAPLPPNPEGSPVMNPVTHVVTDGVWTLTNLPFGAYLVYEVSPPENYSILPAQNHGLAYAFWLAPPNLTVRPSEPEEGADEPEVVINWDEFRELLQSMAGIDIGDEPDLGAILGILADLLADLDLQVILPDHITNPSYEFEFDPVISSIQVQFRNYPYGSVEIAKFSTATGQGLAGAHFRLEGYSIAGSQHSSYPIRRDGITETDGRLLFENIPAGHFTITELQPPPGYILGRANDPHSVTQGVNVAWGNRTTVHFFNDPEGYLIIEKIDGVTGAPLSGAVFEVSGHSGTQQGTTSGGRVQFNGLTPGHQYIVRELAPPPGFVMMEGSRSIEIQPGRNTMVWENWRNPTLTIVKVDQDSGARLAGAHFTVIFEDGSIPNNLPELVTNANGEIVIDGALLDWNAERTLIITEIVPPHGFHLGEENWQRVTLRAGYNQTVVFGNRRRPTLTIAKLDSVLGTPIANAVFHIEKLDEPERGPLTGNPFRTNEQGQIVLPIRHSGRYLIREIQAAPNYWLDPQQSNREWIIDVLPNEDYYLTVENTLLPTLVITKINMINHRPVPLTWFRVYYEVPLSNQVVFVTEQMTNERGQIILPFVNVGWYRIFETRPAPGMSLNVNNSYRIWLEPGRNTYSLLQQGLLPREFDFMRVDSISGNPNPDADADNAPNEDLDIPADEVEQLPPSENSIPDDIANMPMTGIEPSVSDITASMQWSDGSNFRDPGGEVWNWPLNSIIIRKICNRTGQLLPNATFDLIHISQGQTGTQGQVIATFTTNHTGIIVITGLLPGSYAVEEVTSPPNFTLSGQTRQLAWLAPDNHSIVELTFANEPYGSLLVSLRCEVTGEPLQNGEFRVTNSAGQVVGTANGLHRTNAQGEFLIPNVPPDTYIVTQTLSPSGHTFGAVQVHQTILVPATGQTYRLEFTNQPYSALIIRKLDSFDSSPIPGTIFRVNRINGELIGEFAADQLGTVEITGLLGHFVITELHVPAGFERDTTTVRSVEVLPQAPSIVTFFSPRLGSLTIEAIDSFGTPLAGANFRVSRQNGELVGIYTTPASGIVNLPALISGWYVVEPIAPSPPGFITADSGRSVDVQPNTAPRTTFVFHRLSVLTIEAVDGDTGAALAGVQFEVRRPSGERISIGTTNNAGVFVVNGIDPTAGAIIIEPLSAPTGFVINEQARTITFALGQNRTERFRAYRMGSMVIELVSNTGAPLQGGRFRVTRPNGVILGDFTTSTAGIITINNLESGVYIVEQISPPTNWVMTDTGRTVEIHATQTTRVQFVNTQMPALIIEKLDTDGNPLAGAEFEVRTLSGELLHRAVTNNGGLITISNLNPQVVIIEEVRAPQGFVITEPARTVEIIAGQNRVERFVNYRAPSLIIEKVDEQGRPLAGAEFEIRRMNGELVHRLVSNNAGLITVEFLEPAAYQLIETRPPEGHAIVEPSRVIEIVAGETRTERFVNPRLATFVIQKVDGGTNEPLQGVVFEITTLAGERIRNNATGSFEFVTDSSGMIRLPELPEGTFVATELRALPGFRLAQPYVFQVRLDSEYIITIRNYRYPDYTIRKIDGHTGEPLAGVTFEIAHFFGGVEERLRNPRDGSFIWTTDGAGLIRVPNLPHGTFVARELRPLPGFRIADPVIFVVNDFEPTTLTIHNYRYSVWSILKLDGHTGEPLQGVVFEVTRLYGTGHTGDRLRNPNTGSFEFITGPDGRVSIGSLGHGTFKIFETRPLPGFIAAEPQIITVTGTTVDTTITFRNYRMGDINLRKIDGDTGAALQGVIFEIHRQNGERVQNPADSTFYFTTDSAGRINLGFLAPGAFFAVEVRALPGYQLAEPVPFEVIQGRDLTVTVRNYRDAQLTIRKINSITRAPLAGVVFEISRPDGTRVINPQTGLHDFVTDERGLIFLPIIEDGRFYLRELRALPGFLIDEEVIAFNIDASARQREHVLVVENTPAAGLLVIVRDAQTRRPLEGIEVEVRHADGRIVTGQMLHGNQPSTPANSPQLAANGNFLTDHRGRVNLNHLSPGVYHVRIISGLRGYQADTDVHVVTVIAGQQAVLEVQTTPLAGFRLLHVDAITGAPIFNAEFMVFDHNNKVVGNFQTDNRGVIDFSAILSAGRYTIRLTRPAPGYSRDDVPRTVEFIAGRVTEIVWEAIPMAGQLQILVLSGDSNQHNALPAGTPLAGTIFEIFEARTGNLVDRIMSNDRGMAVSNPLPFGRYIARQVAAPAFYMINPQEIHFEVEHENQIIRATFPNFSANMGVTIRAMGPREVMQGHNIFYEIPVIRNDSSTPLADFFWRSILPTNAVRADRLITGTFNHALRYRVMATTNRGNWIVVADNLSTLTNNVIELRPVHLGLGANEYIVDITLLFGQVPAGFTNVLRPRLYVDVLNANQAFLPDGMMFAYKTDTGGRIPGTEEFVISNDTAATTIFNPRRLPQSGW